MDWLSEWLLFNIKWVNFLAISWWEQVKIWWEDDDVCLVLDNMSNWIFIVLAQWNNRQQLDMWLLLAGLTLEGDSGEEVVLWRLISLSRLSRLEQMIFIASQPIFVHFP